MTAVTPEDDGPLFRWPWNIDNGDHLSRQEILRIAAELNQWLRATTPDEDLDGAMPLAREIASQAGSSRKIHAVRDLRSALRDRGDRDFSLYRSKQLIDRVWDENGWTAWHR